MVGERRLPYDYLVLATGASHSYFGRDEWGPYAPGLKRIEDATEVRRRMLTAFERAEATEDEVERRSLLTFLIVGGGPTGVELAGAISELARFGMEKEFRHFDPAQAQGDPGAGRAAHPADLPRGAVAEGQGARWSGSAWKSCSNSRVERIDDEGVTVSGTRIPARTVLWAAGVVASPAVEVAEGGKPTTPAASRSVPILSVPGLPNVFAIGDTALSLGWNGQPVPGLAPAAKQGGGYVAQGDPGARRRADAAQAFRLYASRQPRDDRPQGGGGRLRLVQGVGRAGLVVLGRGASGLPGGRAQPRVGDVRLVLGLPDLSRRD